MKRTSFLAALVLVAAALAAPASTQEGPTAPNASIIIEHWNNVPVDSQQQLIDRLQAAGLLDEFVPSPTDKAVKIALELYGLGKLYFSNDDEAAAYRRGYAKACSDIQLQYPDLELEGC